ncbi:hypothetical protein F9K94_21865 [Brucella tritici]|uniref:Uncharacterized protein n=1 Tax=Brucella tritici TaxID=94626 RepID=A0A7V7VR53_9HYPH|nr:hypothetical protein [Brucella tritici]KAB2655202.1 hypothetical protein F9K94_21865 [Brucella tritici]
MVSNHHYYDTMRIIRGNLEQRGYRGRTTNKTEFYRAFEDDQEGTILVRSGGGRFTYHWSYRSNGEISDSGITKTIDDAIDEINLSQALDSEINYRLSIEDGVDAFM